MKWFGSKFIHPIRSVKHSNGRMKHSALIFLFVIFSILIAQSLPFVLLDRVNGGNRSYEYSLNSFGDPRGKKHKYHVLLPLVATALLIKSVIFPLILKAMAVMTSIAVLLSFKSLIVASIIAYAKFAQSTTAPNVKVVYVDKKPLVQNGWTPPEEYIVPPIFRTKFSYVPRSESLNLDHDKTEIIDHYHTFVD